jgi:hypothetical protein
MPSSVPTASERSSAGGRFAGEMGGVANSGAEPTAETNEALPAAQVSP